MDEKPQVALIAERIRKEPFNMLTNNCLRKSFKFRKECRKIGIEVGIVFALVLTRCDKFPLPRYVVWFHGWAVVDGRRIELARPLDEKNTANTFDIDIRPLVAIHLL